MSPSELGLLSIRDSCLAKVVAYLERGEVVPTPNVSLGSSVNILWKLVECEKLVF